MLGAIIGDVVGSPYERSSRGIKTCDFPLIGGESRFTDDSVMTVAVADALMSCDDASDDLQLAAAAQQSMRRLGRRFPDAGYGERFMDWLQSDDPQPYGSWGNGSAMRTSPVGWWFDTLDATERAAACVAAVTHDHPEGIKGACAVSAAVYLMRTGSTKRDVVTYVEGRYGYDLHRTLDQMRPGYRFDVSCQGSVPQALRAWLEADGFEQAIRLAVSLGGDSDTIACMAGAVAEATWGVPEPIASQVRPLLAPELTAVVGRWYAVLAERGVRGGGVVDG